MSFYDRLAAIAVRHRRAALAGWVVAILGALTLAPVFESKLLGTGYDAPGTESAEAREQIQELTGFSERVTLVVSSELHVATDPEFRTSLRRAIKATRAANDEILVRGPRGPGGGTSEDGHAVFATVGLTGGAAERQELSEVLQEKLDTVTAGGVEAGLTGDSPLLADLIRIEHEDIIKAEVIGLPIAAVILLFAFGSVVAAGLPLLLAVAGLLIGFALIVPLMFFIDFNVFVESVAAMIGIAIGIDYSLLFVRRFREERDRTGSPEEAITRTLATAGRTVAFSGAIVAASIAPIAIVDVPLYGEAAIAVMIVVVVAVCVALTLLPSVLLMLGDRLDRLAIPRRKPLGERQGWSLWARWVLDRPRLVFAAGASLLLLATVPVLDLKTGIDLNARAMEGEESVKALRALQDHVPNADLGPVEILVTGSPVEVRETSAAVTRLTESEPRLASVHNFRLETDAPDAASLVVASSTVGVDTSEAEHLVRDLRSEIGDLPPRGAEVAITGITAITVDYSDETGAVTPLVVALALLLSMLLLTMVFRSPLLAAKAILMNLLTVGAAFGLTILAFQNGLAEGAFGFESLGYIQTWVPLTMFMLLFGLAMDYEVFIVTRMREEWERTGSNEDAIAVGLQRTGGVVTSAALIMVAIFASFITTSIPEMKQMGFGLAVAILIDATLVRAVMVPAFMGIAGKWNWWMPGWLDRILPDLRH